MRRIAPLPHPCVRGAGATSSGYARSRRPSTTAAPMQPPKGLPKCYLCGWFAADCPPAPPMRPWRWGNDIGLRPSRRHSTTATPMQPPKGLPKHGYRTEATEKSIIIFSLSKAIMIIIVFSYALIWPYKCYLCGWFAADSPPAPPMRPWRWGNVIGLRPKPPPQHHGRPVQPPKGLPKCYLCGWFAADCPPAPPMRPWRWGNVIGLRPKPPPQHHGRPVQPPKGLPKYL